LRFERGVPQRIYCDNGTEFVSAAMDLWAYTTGVILDFSRRGKPTDNATIESFNGRFREECLPECGEAGVGRRANLVPIRSRD
jgi:putative transposase